jgi:hypothetical protein
MVACRTLFTVVVVLVTGPSVSTLAAQPASNSEPLTVEQVLKLSQGGVSEDLIITTIKKNGKPFDLNTDEILELRKSGVSDTVIRFLLDPTQPYTQPAPPAKPADLPPAAQARPVPTRKYPEDKYASRVPSEAGLYIFPQDSPVKVEIKSLLGEKEGAGLGKVLLKKGKVIAYLAGPASKTRVAEGSPVLYLRFPDGKSIEDLVLVTLERKGDRRELDVGPPGAKPELKPEAVRQFDSVEVGAGLYRLTPAKLSKGEYMFYLNGSADPAKGNYGKGYDFGAGSVLGEKH